jgi:hypothetical protein
MKIRTTSFNPYWAHVVLQLKYSTLDLWSLAGNPPHTVSVAPASTGTHYMLVRDHQP